MYSVNSEAMMSWFFYYAGEYVAAAYKHKGFGLLRRQR